MNYTTIGAINEYASETINPALFPDTTFEVYSVPVFETGHPEFLRGDEIGSTKQVVRKDDVLICKINPRINRVWVVADESDKQNIASSEWIVVRTKEYNPEFLGWYFRSSKFKALMVSEVAGIGGSLTRAQPKRVAGYPVPLLNRSQQDEIVQRLNLTKRIIEARRRQLLALDTLIKVRFVEMFGDPVSNPKAWPVRPLLDMGDCKNGMNFHYDDSGVELHCLGVGDFQNHSIIEDTSTLSMVSLNDLPSDEYMLRDDDIVFVRSNGNKALVGRCVAVYPRDVPTTFSGFCIRYRKRDEGVVVPYLLRVLKTDSMRAKMAGRGANIQNLNQQILGTLIIPVPPLGLQERFAAFVSQVDKSKAAVQAALDKARVMFDGLMQEYFG